MRVRRRQRLPNGPGHFSGDAVGHADRAPSAVIVLCAETSGGRSEVRGDGDAIEQSELGHVESSLFLICVGDADQVIEDLGDSDCSEGGVAAVQDGLDFGGGRLGPQQGDDGVRVEDGQRRAARADSS